jgi:hypothetical protein
MPSGAEQAITRVHIAAFRPRRDVNLDPGCGTFATGPNGAGKADRLSFLPLTQPMHAMTPILRISHIDNLLGILATGGIWAPNHLPPGTAQPANITHADIVARRAQKVVPVGPGGLLHDYVPFYFGARSPMLYANHSGWVRTNPDGQAVVVYLVAYAEEVAQAGHGWAFTDGHAEMGITAFFDDLARLPELDWASIRATQWGGPKVHPDLKRRKQAEFLVHRFFPWDLVRGMVVLDVGMQARVRDILARAGRAAPVAVRRAWYY